MLQALKTFIHTSKSCVSLTINGRSMLKSQFLFSFLIKLPLNSGNVSEGKIVIRIRHKLKQFSDIELDYTYEDSKISLQNGK